MLKSMIICISLVLLHHQQPGTTFSNILFEKSGVDLGTATNLVVEQSTLYQNSISGLILYSPCYNSFYNIFPPDNILRNLVIIGFVVNFIVIVVLLFYLFWEKIKKYIILKFFSFLHR